MQSITKMINCLTTARNNTTQQLNDHSSKTDQHISQPSYHSTGLLIDNQDKTQTPDIIVVYPDHDTKTTREDNKSANLLIDNCSPYHTESKSDDTQKIKEKEPNIHCPNKDNSPRAIKERPKLANIKTGKELNKFNDSFILDNWCEEDLQLNEVIKPKMTKSQKRRS